MRRLSTSFSALSTAALRTVTRETDLLAAWHPGQGLVEYGLILVLIMVVCVAILTLVGKNVSELWYGKIVSGW